MIITSQFTAPASADHDLSTLSYLRTPAVEQNMRYLLFRLTHHNTNGITPNDVPQKLATFPYIFNRLQNDLQQSTIQSRRSQRQRFPSTLLTTLHPTTDPAIPPVSNLALNKPSQNNLFAHSEQSEILSHLSPLLNKLATFINPDPTCYPKLLTLSRNDLERTTAILSFWIDFLKSESPKDLPGSVQLLLQTLTDTTVQSLAHPPYRIHFSSSNSQGLTVPRVIFQNSRCNNYINAVLQTLLLTYLNDATSSFCEEFTDDTSTTLQQFRDDHPLFSLFSDLVSYLHAHPQTSVTVNPFGFINALGHYDYRYLIPTPSSALTCLRTFLYNFVCTTLFFSLISLPHGLVSG